MRTCIHQTEAKGNFCPASEEAILHILSDVKMTYSTLTQSPLVWQKVRSEKGSLMFNERRIKSSKILQSKGGG